MAWGSDTAATQLTSITTEQFFDQAPTLNPRETAHVQVSVDFPGSPTDHAIVAVYTTHDERGAISAPTSGVVGQTVFIQFSVAKFVRDTKTKQPNVEFEFQILDEETNAPIPGRLLVIGDHPAAPDKLVDSNGDGLREMSTLDHVTRDRVTLLSHGPFGTRGGATTTPPVNHPNSSTSTLSKPPSSIARESSGEPVMTMYTGRGVRSSESRTRASTCSSTGRLNGSKK